MREPSNLAARDTGSWGHLQAIQGGDASTVSHYESGFAAGFSDLALVEDKELPHGETVLNHVNKSPDALPPIPTLFIRRTNNRRKTRPSAMARSHPAAVLSSAIL